MILTVTPNPSVDRTVFLDALIPGSVNRSIRSWSEPSGKGINVALALRAHGNQVRAVHPIGGSVGAQLRQMLTHAGLDTVEVPVAGEIRSNFSLTQPDGTVTKINEAGHCLDDAETVALIDAVARSLDGVDCLVCAGSLPAGAPVDLYAQLAELGHRRRVRVVVDSSGPPLAASLSAHPDLIKPNEYELAELVDAKLDTLGDVIDAAHDLRDRGVSAVLASLGADGVVLFDAAGALHAEAPVSRVVSTVGAGDALLAGYLSTGSSREQHLATALQWAAAAVAHEGTLFTPGSERPDVVIHQTPNRSRRLRNHQPAPAGTSNEWAAT